MREEDRAGDLTRWLTLTRTIGTTQVPSLNLLSRHEAVVIGRHKKAHYFYRGFKGQSKRTGQLKLNQVLRSGLSKIKDFYYS